MATRRLLRFKPLIRKLFGDTAANSCATPKRGSSGDGEQEDKENNPRQGDSGAW